MKYDLKAMDYDPDATCLGDMFDWEETPEGFDCWYWSDLMFRMNGEISEDTQEKLDAMRKQYEEEQMPMDLTKIDVPFGELSDMDQERLKYACRSGNVIQMWCNRNDEWGVVYNPSFNKCIKYRVRPDEPEPKTVKTTGSYCNKGQKPKSHYVYEIEFEIDKNGHPDWTTAKVTGK